MQHQEQRSGLALSLVIPVYNEMENVKPLVEEIRQCFAGRSDYETIFVDDGSTDSTLERLVDLRKTGAGSVRIIRHRSNYGKSC